MDILAIAAEEQERALGIVADLQRVPVVLSRATTLLGSFTVDKRTGAREIRISRHLVEEAQVRDTVRHELAHQAAFDLNGHLGHGPAWQTWARYLGCEPVACTRGGIDPAAAAARVRYVIACRTCGWHILRQKRTKIVRNPRRYLCGRCRGPLAVAVL